MIVSPYSSVRWATEFVGQQSQSTTACSPASTTGITIKQRSRNLRSAVGVMLVDDEPNDHGDLCSAPFLERSAAPPKFSFPGSRASLLLILLKISEKTSPNM